MMPGFVDTHTGLKVSSAGGIEACSVYQRYPTQVVETCVPCEQSAESHSVNVSGRVLGKEVGRIIVP